MIDADSSDMKGSPKQWDDISCPICMDHPHNAVLIICSSHDKGCKPYICETRNCLDRFKQLHSKTEDGSSTGTDNLKCPLCRGSIVGWVVVKEVREYLDSKLRVCDSCSFSGSYEELVGHAREEQHHTNMPADDVDPTRRRGWHWVENESEYMDVITALRSEMPGALVVEDYVIDSSMFSLEAFRAQTQTRSHVERRRCSF